MSKRLYIAILVIVSISLLAGGATFAYFSDQASNTDNNFQTGTLSVKVDRNLGDPVPGPMFYTVKDEGNFPVGSLNPGHPTGPWYPGKEETRQLIVQHGITSTMDFKIKGFSAALRGISDLDVASQFADAMNVTIYESFDPTNILFEDNLTTLLSGEQLITPSSLRPYVSVGSNQHLSFCVKMIDGADNSLQGIKPLVDFSVFVEQAANNP
jgi:predicted ribosomally synthesized peptide with SipW-like signal peptide